VQGKAVVRSVERKTEFCVFDIELPPERANNVAIGASVAINGTCLTVVHQEDSTLRFDVMMETLRRTNLGTLEPGSAVNFERSARVGDEIGGHTVSGHVHTTATIAKVEDSENNRRVEFQASKAGH
jgi:riboflavin synthase